MAAIAFGKFDVEIFIEFQPAVLAHVRHHHGAATLARVRTEPAVILPVFDRSREIAIAGAEEIRPEKLRIERSHQERVAISATPSPSGMLSSPRISARDMVAAVREKGYSAEAQ